MGMSLKKSKLRLEKRLKGYEQLVQRSNGGGKEYTKPGSMKK